ncbi:MAG: dienelactone hydrolase family protein [Armatimonadetes bacterium]|nr:dienelactone hydrolase family protein [Armatimonadota bacterium]
MITALAAFVLGDVLGHKLEYKVGNDSFVGYVAKAAHFNTSKPVIYVVQDWNGVDAHEEEVVEKLAHQGYTAFAIDIYGKGVRPHSVETCSAESGKYYKDSALFMKRIQDGIKAFPTKGKKFLVGYCFGGSGVLEFARRNLGAYGVVSFHGGLASLSPKPAKKVNARVLVLHGADDPFNDPKDVEACKKEFKVAKSFKFVSYPGVVHAFTVKDMGFQVEGAKYDKNADEKSWIELLKFLMANA